MMGYKVRQLNTRTSFSLETLVPEGNFYRQVETCIVLSFVRDLVCHLYSAFGRPSIDPVVFFKLQLIAFFEGIRSERLLMETVSLNLAHRWFIGYHLDEDMPDHTYKRITDEKISLTDPDAAPMRAQWQKLRCPAWGPAPKVHAQRNRRCLTLFS